MTTAIACPCHSGRAYSDCCQPLHNGKGLTHADTVESLMRSRFSAFVLERMEYIQRTWHPDTRPGDVRPDAHVRWAALEVLHAEQQAEQGRVRFSATFFQRNPGGLEHAGHWCQLQETSRFVKLGQQWLYLDGQADWLDLSPGRNDACPCGSGTKFKKCCAQLETSPFFRSG